jgi:hypothetical protein
MLFVQREHAMYLRVSVPAASSLHTSSMCGAVDAAAQCIPDTENMVSPVQENMHCTVRSYAEYSELTASYTAAHQRCPIC